MLTAVLLTIFQVTLKIFGVESRGVITLFNLCIFMAFLFDLYLFGSERGTASDVNERTRKSVEAYGIRVLINVILLLMFSAFTQEDLKYINGSVVMTPDWIAGQIRKYVLYFTYPRMATQYLKLVYSIWLEQANDNFIMARMMAQTEEIVHRDQNENIVDDDVIFVAIIDAETENKILVGEKNQLLHPMMCTKF